MKGQALVQPFRRGVAPRHLVLVALCGLLSGCAVRGLDGLSPEQKSAAQRVEAYLNRPVMLQGNFTQVGPRDNGGAGRFTYQPGALALDYLSPHPMTLRASGAHLVLDDSQTGAVTRLSLSRNPLGLLLHVPVRFGGSIRVTDMRRVPGASQISLAEADNPSQGLLTLRFIDHDRTLVLSTLDGVDARGNHIVLSLSDVSETGVSPKN